MQLSMMAVDGERLFDACKRFLIIDLKSIVKNARDGLFRRVY